MKHFLLFILIIFVFLSSKSQELMCNVQVNSSQVQASDRTVFENLQTSIYEFMNNRRWTNYEFKVEERIECSILINVSTWDNMESFSGTIQVQSRRPAYNSSYSTTLLNYQDKDFTFKFVSGQPLDYIENTFTSNLTSVLAFYAYIIIGMDFDSFEEMGGSQFYEKALSIVNAAQSNNADKGWKAAESQRNRYWIIENILNGSYSDFRKSIFYYHLEGIDLLASDINKGRAGVMEGITLLQKAYRQKPGLFIINLYMLAKTDELVNIFTPAPMVEKTKAVNILKSIDPVNSNKYNKILESK
ncbi:MAG: DUF4835 family protein [Bacteroidales bacterium]|jgi:hypothetical protein|nr:DUF4835 family protein [Bacteroidales bacterium]